MGTLSEWRLEWNNTCAFVTLSDGSNFDRATLAMPMRMWIDMFCCHGSVWAALLFLAGVLRGRRALSLRFVSWVVRLALGGVGGDVNVHVNLRHTRMLRLGLGGVGGDVNVFGTCT